MTYREWLQKEIEAANDQYETSYLEGNTAEANEMSAMAMVLERALEKYNELTQ